ncbi:pescadillo homolog, putative [Plasmodium vinckei lentum]|uniref:Pescadillo homolog n=1 Tax=Plasmodium vinckei lentum TaxID=138297 RepID=A0A6V7S3A9_PLAVN|nr:pescadillo homolog, putative [Plasmodium vinckei lentum]
MHIHKLKAKIKKKNQEKYLTKRKIQKKLFLNESEFRRLCIFKGIYPKDYKDIPLKLRNKFHKNKVYYTRSDYKKLSNEKIIQDFRKIKTGLKRYKKYKLSLEDNEKCKSIIRNFPKYKLDHIIKERFPILVYAVEQLNDALTAIIAYSFLPSNENIGIKNNLINQSIILRNHFHYYTYKTNKIKKGFISVKGYYLQAEILQKKITWLIPHIFTPYFDKSIDFKVITNFIEYYVTLLRFVLYKLYRLDGLSYPPKEYTDLKNEKLNHLAFDKNFITKEIANELEAKESTEQNTLEDSEIKTGNDEIAEFEKNNQENEINEPSKNGEKKKKIETKPIEHDIINNDNTKSVKNLFKNQIFYIHSNMPFDVLSIIILSCGGTICWNSLYSPYKYEDKSITHEILEVSGENMETQNSNKTNNINEYTYKRSFIQPQYIFDCLNTNKILSCEDYNINKTLPVHLSPFIDDDNYKDLVKKDEYTINKMLSEDPQYNKSISKNKTNSQNQYNNYNDNENEMSEDEYNNAIRQKLRNDALNNQMEAENENNYNPQNSIKQENDLINVKKINSQENIKRNKLALSKKKRKLYNRIEQEENRQKLTIEKFIKKNKNKKSSK